jgi:hypothetical protein
MNWVLVAERLPTERDGEFAMGNVLAQRAGLANHFEVVSIEFLAKLSQAYSYWSKIIPHQERDQVKTCNCASAGGPCVVKNGGKS